MSKPNLKLKLTQAFFLSLSAILGFGILAVKMSGEKLNAFDSFSIHLIQGLESSALTRVMKFFTTAGSTVSVFIISCLILWYLFSVLHHRAEAILFFTVNVGAAVINQSMKLVFHRPRPDDHRLIDITGYSFPSGHSMSAFAMYGILVFLLWRHLQTSWGRFLIILIGTAMTLAIGISRIYLGVHYPSDVLGGYLAGAFWLAASIWVYQSIAESRYKQSSSQA